MDNKGYYKILGLSAGASDADIKRAYSRKILDYHPDQGRITKKVKAMPDGPEKQAKIKEMEDVIRKLNESKNVLSDPEKKKMYDQGMDENVSFDMDGFDIFDFMGGRRNKETQKKVADTEFSVKFTLKDSFSGKSKTFNVKRDIVCKGCSGLGGKDSRICKKCNGKGEYQIKRQMGFMFSIDTQKCDGCAGQGTVIVGKSCNICKGTRYEKMTETVSVDFKKGFKNGETIVIKGKGDEYVGAIPGDLVLIAQVEPDAAFKRIGNHILTKTEIDLHAILFGGTIGLRHIDGKILNVHVGPLRDIREDSYVVFNQGFHSGTNIGNLYIDPSIIMDHHVLNKLKQTMTMPRAPPSGMAVSGSISKLPKETKKENGTGSSFKESIFSSFFGGF